MLVLVGAGWGLQLVKITDGDGTIAAIENQSLSVIQHAHSDNGVAHFYATGLTSGTHDFIVVDLSDTTNYPHDYSASEVHIDWIKYEIDSDNTGVYIIGWGFLENVDDTNGDLHIVDHISGSKSVGNSMLGYYNYTAAGPQGNLSKVVTGHKAINDVAFQTDVNLPTTLSPGAATTPSGDGDFILRNVQTAGTIDIVLTIGYHTHSSTHP